MILAEVSMTWFQQWGAVTIGGGLFLFASVLLTWWLNRRDSVEKRDLQLRDDSAKREQTLRDNRESDRDMAIEAAQANATAAHVAIAGVQEEIREEIQKMGNTLRDHGDHDSRLFARFDKNIALIAQKVGADLPEGD